MSWLDGLVRHADAGRACVVVTVAAMKGSAPRGVGTRMTVGADGFDGTIGGGALELAALTRARALLAEAAGGGGATGAHEVTETVPLGRALSQCCGGEITLRFEHHPGVDFRVEVFGAGHVAQELARLLVRLPCRATFHDARAEWLDRLHALEGGDALRTTPLGEDVHSVIEAGPANAYWLVMTHSHELDLEVVEAVLARGDSRYCGLIASRSKAASFRGRLARKGFSEAEIARLTAPLGARVDTGNTPMEVAIAAVADVLSAHSSFAANERHGVGTAPAAAADTADPDDSSAAVDGPGTSVGSGVVRGGTDTGTGTG